MARPRSFDETQVISMAREVFRDHGYTATSIEELTAATGLRRSSLYGAFGDKRGLFLHALESYCEDVIAAVERQLEGDQAGAFSRLAAHLHAQTDDPSASRRGCLLAKGTAERAHDDPEVARLAARAYQRYQDALAGCIQQAQVAGEIRDDLDPGSGAAMLLAVLRGIEALGRAPRDGQDLHATADATLGMLRPVAAPQQPSQ